MFCRWIDHKTDSQVLLALLKQTCLYEGEIIVLNPVLEKSVRDLDLDFVIVDREGLDWFYPSLETLGIHFFSQRLQDLLPHFVHDLSLGDR